MKQLSIVVLGVALGLWLFIVSCGGACVAILSTDPREAQPVGDWDEEEYQRHLERYRRGS